MTRKLILFPVLLLAHGACRPCGAQSTPRFLPRRAQPCGRGPLKRAIYQPQSRYHLRKRPAGARCHAHAWHAPARWHTASHHPRTGPRDLLPLLSGIAVAHCLLALPPKPKNRAVLAQTEKPRLRLNNWPPFAPCRLSSSIKMQEWASQNGVTLETEALGSGQRAGQRHVARSTRHAPGRRRQSPFRNRRQQWGICRADRSGD